MSEQTAIICLFTSGSGSGILDYCFVSTITAKVALSQNQTEGLLAEKVSTPG